MRYLLTLMLLLWMVSGAVAQAQDLHFCYESGKNPPFRMAEEGKPKINNKSKGNLIELTAQAVKNAGFHPVFYRRPWADCIKDLKSGKADGILPMVWLAQREAWGRFPETDTGAIDESRALRQANYRIFVPVKRKVTWDGQQFSHLTSGIGAPQNYVVYHQLKKAGVLSSMNLDTANGFKMLALNRIDGYVVEQKVGLKIINDAGWQHKIKMLPMAYHVSYFHLQFSHQFFKTNAVVANKIWHEISQLRKFYIKNP